MSVAFASFAGCSHSVHLALPVNTPVRVLADSWEQLIPPSDVRCDELGRWLARNQKGWSPVFATNPGGGILVTAGDMWLQFIGTTVFTRTPDGLLRKKVEPHDYAYLLPREASNQSMKLTAGSLAINF